MAKGKYAKWLEKSQLDKLVNWAANGCTDKELAYNMGISRETYYKWMGRHADIADAIKKGREMAVESVENAFFMRAVGMCEETTTVKEIEQKLVDGKLATVHQVVRETTRKLPPDTSALIFYLKNKVGYRSEPEVEVSVETAPRFYFDRAELEQD